MKLRLLFALFSAFYGFSTQASEVMVAVAANFTAPMQKIAQAFEQDTGHKAVLSFGSTGHFYAQIKNGAPYQLLMAADDETPAQLEKEGRGVVGSRFTYATGKLVLWSKQVGAVDSKGEVLRQGKFQQLAVANPKLAPYGAAAFEVMAQLGVLQDLRPKLVQGESIAQTYQFIASENAQLGFVALAQIMVDGKITQGSAWLVPAHLHAPLQQDALLLVPGRDKPAAVALMAYLKGDRAKTIIRSFGYTL